ncbi:hypothetical protein [Brevibacillus brevis]|uniref:hypothetical protein n=1 Tax=Brevibacillus brevis TaxID=1393 RepID=UPI0007D8C5BC|nr:hypothetical protein [Brevibacillus brevis]
MKDLRKILDLYSKDDIEAAQDRDYDLWVYDLQNRIQSLYDDILVNRKHTPKRKAALDIALMEVEIAVGNAEKLIRGLK